MSSILDQALERLQGTSTEVVGGGDPNHGPMVAETLVALDRADIVIPWVDAYRRRLGSLLPATSPIASDSWPSALGRVERIGDWAVFFRGELGAAPWPTVLRAWLPRLLPASISAGMHGLIRTAHIARALAGEETPQRLEELAVALAYWASFYRELRGRARFAGTLPVDLALERIPRVLAANLSDGMPRDVVFVVGEQPTFQANVELAGVPASLETGLSTLTEVGARAYLANADRNPLVLLHTVTGPAALRLLLPHIESAARWQALAAIYHCSAAWIAGYAGPERFASSDAAVGMVERAIVDRCVETQDPHAIKFVEACLREHELNPKPIYLAAALDWAARLRRAADWTSAQRGAAGIGFG
jgi:hypothetical protein